MTWGLRRQLGERVLKLVLNDVARTFDFPPNPVTTTVRINPEKARD